MPEDPRPNPFKHMGEWYWRDEKGQTHGPFKQQRDALFDLLSWAYPDYQPNGLRAGVTNALLFELPLVILILVAIFLVAWQMTPEGRVKAKVKKALATLPGHYHFMPVQMGMGAPSLDFLCCWRGKFFAIETKVPGKKLTERQQVTAKQIIDADGQVFLCDTDESIARMLSDLRIQARTEFCKKYPTLLCQ